MVIRLPRLLPTLAATSLALVLGACGTSKPAASGPASSDASTTSATTLVAAASATTDGGPNGAAPNGSGPLTSDQRVAFTAYRDCITSHGVTLGRGRRPGGGGAGDQGSSTSDATTTVVTTPPTTVDPAVLKAAMDACTDKLPAGIDPTRILQGGGFGGGGFGGGGGGRGGAAFQAYLSCLKDNGVKVPDTSSTSAGTPPSGPPASIDRSDPAFPTANAKCSALLPARNNGGSSSTADASSSTTTNG